MQKFIIIAIDGPAASGKSTLAKYLADKLGFLYVDTGAMYRAITYYALEKNIENDEDAVVEAAKNINLTLQYSNGLTRVFIDGKEVTDNIRTPKVNSKVSDISRIKDVRVELVKLQQKFGENNNLVVEGRDTTTVVFPNADLKIFLTANAKERAKRRYLEFKEKGVEISLDEVEKSLLNRDTIDSSRKVSPLTKAKDAIEVDTTNLTIQEEVNRILNIVEKIINK
ncbi:MAG: (d)CMP kinase [Ignavibacteriales bacterium]|nr:(d)CMP kinase [Ignavibacteriales bacterium]MCB9210242.1 (d)CMP kinase [Ignavibacteriales bacterium]MCB9219037.1 (d)CMP kinase [Ignavibacteriales bacterium]MCB9259622.1 (d)CMP kinase [Ignavibacteriales bacterium]